MPKSETIPFAGTLPFGPGKLVLQGLNPVILKAGSVNFLLGMEGFSKRVYRLDWTIDLEAAEVDRDGDRRGRTVISRYHVPTMTSRDPASLSVPLGAVGVYRVETTFMSHGHKLGRFGEYVRVVRRRDSAKLLLNTHSVSPGGFMAARVLNRGTTTLSFGFGLALYRRTGSGWENVTPLDNYVAPVAIDVPPGVASPCQGFRIPSEAQPGSYEFKQRYRFVDGHSAWVTAPFSVR
jgi:hypothetical protein